MEGEGEGSETATARSTALRRRTAQHGCKSAARLQERSTAAGVQHGCKSAARLQEHSTAARAQHGSRVAVEEAVAEDHDAEGQDQ